MTDNKDKPKDLIDEKTTDAIDSQVEQAEQADSSKDSSKEEQKPSFDTSYITFAPGHKSNISSYVETIVKECGVMHIDNTVYSFNKDEAFRLFLLDLTNKETTEKIQEMANPFSEGKSITTWFLLIRSLQEQADYQNYYEQVIVILKEKHGLILNVDYRLSSTWNIKQIDQTFLMSGLELGQMITSFLAKLKRK